MRVYFITTRAVPSATYINSFFVSLASSSGYHNCGCVVDGKAEPLMRGTTQSHTAKFVKAEAGAEPKVKVISFPKLCCNGLAVTLCQCLPGTSPVGLLLPPLSLHGLCCVELPHLRAQDQCTTQTYDCLWLM